MQAFAKWLAGTPVSQGIQHTLWLIPLLQAIHILAIAAVMSAVAMIGLNVTGLSGRSQTLVEVARRFVPWLWAGLAVLAATGIVLIIGEPRRSLLNPAFQIKMLLLAGAIGLTLAFEASLRRNAMIWDAKSGPGAAIKLAAVGTFLLWCAIALAGRWIAYVNVA